MVEQRKKKSRNLGPTWWDYNSYWSWDAVNNRFRKNNYRSRNVEFYTFLRNSVAFHNTEESVWQQFEANQIARNSVTGARIEPAITNMLLNSDNLFSASWTLPATGTRTATTIAAPVYGTWTRIGIGSEIAGGLLIQQANFAITVPQTYTAWAYVMGEGANIGKTMAIEIKRASGGSYAGVTIQVTLTDKPQLIQATFTSITDNTTGAVVFKVGSTNQASEFLLACPQFEIGTKPTVPVRTGATNPAKPEDALTMKLDKPSRLKIEYSEIPSSVTGSTLIYKGVNNNVHKAAGKDYAIQRLYWNSDVLKFTVKPGDVVSFDTADKERSEITDNVRTTKGDDIWNSYAVKVGSGFVTSTNPGAWFILGQWHGDSDADGRSPYISANIYGTDFVVDMRRWNGSSQIRSTVYRLPNFERDVWHNIVMQHKVDQTNGYFRMWLNGVQIVDYTGQFGYWDHTNGGYWKAGIYRSAASYDASVSYQNMEKGNTSLAARITSPLSVDNGIQFIDATPTNGNYTLNASALNHSVIKSINAIDRT